MYNLNPYQSFSLNFGSAISGFFGSYFGAQTQKENLKAQMAIARLNADLARMDAEFAMMKGEKDIANLTLKAGNLKGAQTARLAASGVDITTGSAAELLKSTDIMKDADVQTIKMNALRESWGYKMQAVNYTNQATIAGSAASGINPMLEGTTNLLGAAGKVASSWYNLNKESPYVSPGASSSVSTGSGVWAEPF